MKISQLAINSISGRGDFEEKLRAFHEAGFRAVEFALPEVKEYLSAHDLEDVKRLLQDNDLVCIGGFECVLLAFAPVEERARNQARLLENAQLLSTMGARTMVVGTDGPLHGSTSAAEEIVAQLAENFAQVGKAIEATGVTMCIEFNWSPVVKSLRTACEIARRANAHSGLSNIGVLFDPAHYHCTPSKFEQLTPENIALIKHVHVDDMRDIPGELSNCNSDRVLPLEGCLDLCSLFGAIESGGYDGYFSIEMFSEELWNMPASAAAQKMYQSLTPLCVDA